MHALIILLAAGLVACSASVRPPASEPIAYPAPVADTALDHPAEVNLSGAWATGSTGEPAAKLIVLHPQCNYSPARWLIEQSGDSVRAWTIPATQSKGTATTGSGSKVPSEGRVSGVNLIMGAAGAHYVLRYDSTSGHLRGTVNGAPFWAVRLEVVRPEGCIAVP